MKRKKIILTGIVAVLSILLGIGATATSGFSFFQSNPDVSPQMQETIEKQILSPLKAMHDPANVKMFSRAYIGSVWKYELMKKPTSKDKYHEFNLREYRGAFIIDQYKMRVYEKDNKVSMEDWVNNKFIAPDQWITFYQNQKVK